MFKEFSPPADWTSDAERGGRLASSMNALLGAWLFFSAFAWSHARFEFLDTASVGAVVFIGALGARLLPALRWISVAASAWLLISTWFIPHHTTGTVWHDVTVAAAIFVFALVPGERPARRNRVQT